MNGRCGSPSSLPSPHQVSLYIHVPFCSRKCDYCHFYVARHNKQLETLYLEALQCEWSLHRTRLSDISPAMSLESIYFGGGTPSLLPPEAIATAIQSAYTIASPTSAIEITLEANPEQITPSLVKEFAATGINRISLGVQSLDDAMLRLLGRNHSAQDACNAVYAVRAGGIDNISIDLMYDLPNQTLIQWESTLKQAIALPITHLSLYNLTIEPNSAFFLKRDALLKQMPQELLSASLYALALDYLPMAGLNQYEISAFAKQGYHSHHNIGYWLGRPFIGLGPSAFSYWRGKRWRNVPHLHRYHTQLMQGILPIDFEEELSQGDKRRELLTIALRLSSGIDLAHFPIDGETSEAIDHLIALGFLKQEDSRLALTRRGLFCYDAVAAELI